MNDIKEYILRDKMTAEEEKSFSRQELEYFRSMSFEQRQKALKYVDEQMKTYEQRIKVYREKYADSKKI